MLFWFLGMVPDLRAVYNQARTPWKKFIFGVLSLGWRGDAVHWKYYKSAYYLLAALATPLVVSVHSIVSLDFAVAIVPGWHSTIFPPYFVAGAILSGFAMVLTLAIPLRRFYHLENLVTLRHLENCAKVMLVTSTIVGYGYCEEALMAWYSGDPYEKYMYDQPRLGNYGFAYWLLIFCNVLVVADAVVAQSAPECRLAVRAVADRAVGHVDGARRDCRAVAAPRLYALRVAHVLSRRSGTGRR